MERTNSENPSRGGDQELDAKTSKIVDKALDQIMDRLENGDHIYDQKTGRIRRAPVKLRELNATLTLF